MPGGAQQSQNSAGRETGADSNHYSGTTECTGSGDKEVELMPERSRLSRSHLSLFFLYHCGSALIQCKGLKNLRMNSVQITWNFKGKRKF